MTEPSTEEKIRNILGTNPSVSSEMTALSERAHQQYLADIERGWVYDPMQAQLILTDTSAHCFTGCSSAVEALEQMLNELESGTVMKVSLVREAVP